MPIDIDTMSDEEFSIHMESVSYEPEDVTDSSIEDTKEEEVVTEDTDTEADEEETSTDSNETDPEESQEEVETTNNESEDTTTVPETGEDTSIDYKEFYEQVTSDYKANGKIMPGIKSPEDFRTALAMASNYALKTTALKPHLGRIKTLEKAGVTDDELNEMLEFRNRNPDVIKKALKETGMDVLDIDLDNASDYKPSNYIMSEKEAEFEDIVNSIKDTPEFSLTSEVLTKVWDEASRKAMFDNPSLILGLNQEISMGRFDKIQAIIEQNKMLGRANGKSDLQMYEEIATFMNTEATTRPTNKETIIPTVKVQDPAIVEQKKQAGISTKKTTTTVKKYDPVKLSDEEFMKLVESGAKFI